jgi:putative membrane protein
MKRLQSLLFAASAAALGVALAGCTTERRVSVNTAPATVATTAPATAMGAAPALNAVDRDFASTAAISGMVEVAASQLALTHASDPQVVSFARMMIEQHTAANNELAAIMRAHGMNPPTALPKTQVDEMSAFGMRSGADFDQFYVRRAGVRAHQDAIAAFQRQMPQLSDPDLRNWAAKTLPVMQQHLAMAQDLAGRMSG